MLARFPVLAVVFAAACGCTPPRTSAPAAPVASAQASLGAIELETLDGAKTPLSAAAAGRPTLVALWATWCETCATEFDALGKLHGKAAAQGAYVLAVAEGEPRATVASFVRARALAYPQLVDERFLLADAIGARRIPVTLVLDRAQKVVFKGGALDREALEALDRLLAAR